MNKLTQAELQRKGYEILNAQISDVDVAFNEQGVLVAGLILSGNGWRIQYGSTYGIGATNPSATEFQGTAEGIELLMRLITLIGAKSFNGLIGKYVRVAVLPQVGEVKIIGNIVEDKWFDIEEFFKPEESVSESDPAVDNAATEPMEETPAEEPKEIVEETAE